MKIIKVQLGGQERTLDVGKFVFTKYLGECIGLDPLNAKVSDFDWLTGIVYAGMMAHCTVNKIQPDFTADTVRGWLEGIEISDATAIITEYLKVIEADKPGEAAAPESGA